MTIAGRNGTPALEEAARHFAEHWPSGQRHQAALALAGGLLRAGQAVEDVEHFLELVAEAADDDEPVKRVSVVAPTAEKLKRKEKVTGWRTLIDLVGASPVGRLRRDLGLTIMLAELAAHKRLPVEFLQSLGLYDLAEGGVGIPYRDGAGRVVEVKNRTALIASKGSWWPKNKSVMAYGEDRLDLAVAAGYLTLVEGESDCWALWLNDFPALGLPGDETPAAALEIGHVGTLGTVYVLQEPDAGGVRFVANVQRRLAALGWRGRLLVVKLDGAKDPADLYQQDPEQFRTRWQQALAQAEPVTVAAEPAEAEFKVRPWPRDLDAAAFHGLAGRIVHAVEPHSEADPAALLIQVLIGFGSLIGRGRYFTAEADRHYLNEFAVLTGKTSKGRKGTSWGQARRPLEQADPEWAAGRVQTGLSSGEGLIWAVRDPIQEYENVAPKGQPKRYELVEADPGVQDKRLCIFEPEFSLILKQIERRGNTLSAILRRAWEEGDLRTLTKHQATCSSGAHISLIAHCTVDELRRYLSTTEAASGFGNRFVWLCVRRSKLLPEGGCPDAGVLDALGAELAAAANFARAPGELRRDEPARAIWREVYGPLSEGQPGLCGSLLARGEAHVARLACLYALLDGAAVVGEAHLLAALAIWEYVQESVGFIFGDALGDPTADEILRALRHAPDGLRRSAVRDLFGGHRSSAEVSRALGVLLEQGLARFELNKDTGGRPEERWFAQEESARKAR
jgi:hypothetical protein